MSSRGQAPEDPDQVESSEDTPQASGSQSPRRLEESGAVGGAVGGSTTDRAVKPRRRYKPHGPRAGPHRHHDRHDPTQPDQEDDDSSGDPFANSDEDEYKPRYMDKYTPGDRRYRPLTCMINIHQVQAPNMYDKYTPGTGP